MESLWMIFIYGDLNYPFPQIYRNLHRTCLHIDVISDQMDGALALEERVERTRGYFLEPAMDTVIYLP